MAVPDIIQNFALSFENYECKGESVYKEQNTVRTRYNEPSGLAILVRYNEDSKKQVFLDIPI